LGRDLGGWDMLTQLDECPGQGFQVVTDGSAIFGLARVSLERGLVVDQRFFQQLPGRLEFLTVALDPCEADQRGR
jgi:hypothetical protein